MRRALTTPILLAGILALALTMGCSWTGSSADNSDTQQAEMNEAIVSDLRMQTGMPAVTNVFGFAMGNVVGILIGQELKLAKMIYELRDSEDLVCYAYIVNLYGELIFLGECIGYGLPYSVQFSAPERLVRTDLGESTGDMLVPQPEPNGLYMPEGLSATWLMLIDPDTGAPRPVYCEPSILVSPFPLH